MSGSEALGLYDIITSTKCAFNVVTSYSLYCDIVTSCFVQNCIAIRLGSHTFRGRLFKRNTKFTMQNIRNDFSAEPRGGK